MLLLFSISAAAISNPTVEWTSNSSFYEFSTNTLEFKISNSALSLHTINYSKLNISPISLDDFNRKGNVINYSSNYVIWNNEIYNGAYVPFSFTTTLPSVNADTNLTIYITTNDTNGNSTTLSLNITILDDNIAPNITSLSPKNFAIIKNSTNYNFEIEAIEQSGLKNGNFNFTSGNMKADFDWAAGSPMTMDCSNYNCNISKLLVDSGSKNYFNYLIYIDDKAGNVAQTEKRWIYIDSKAPVIDVLSSNLIYTNKDVYNLSFNFSDASLMNHPGFAINSFNTSLNCTISIDSLNKNFAVNANGTKSVELNLSSLNEGENIWNITCADEAGWQSNISNNKILIDKTGPVITPFDFTNDSVISPKVITINVSDNLTGVSDVTFDGSSINSSKQLNLTNYLDGVYSLIIFANDTLGNPSTVTFKITIDTTGPSITLNGPANNTNLTYFNYTASDVNSNLINCSLLLNGTIINTKIINSGEEVIVNYNNLIEETLAWNVICADELGNSNNSETLYTIIDNLGPRFTSASNNVSERLDSINHQVTALDLSNPINYVINDSIRFNISSTGNITNNTYLPVGDYYLTITAIDGKGNQANATIKITVEDTIAPIINDTLVNLTLTNNTDGSVTFIWQNDTSEDVNSYNIYISTTPITNLSNSTRIGTNVVSGWSDILVSPKKNTNTTYYYLITVVDASGNEDNVSLKPQVNITTATDCTNLWSNPLWSTCVDSKQSRTLTKSCYLNSIPTTKLETQTCTMPRTYSGGGGGSGASSSYSSTCTENITCSFWSYCTNNVEKRTCSDINNCGITPETTETRECSSSGNDLIILEQGSGDSNNITINGTESNTDTNSSLNLLTGNVVGAGNSLGMTSLYIFIGLIILGYGSMYAYRKFNKKK